MSAHTRDDLELLAIRHIKTLKERRSILVGSRTMGYRARLIDERVGGQWHVGYSWTRPYAHHLSGLVQDCVMGRGPDANTAFTRANAHVQRLEAKALARGARL